MRRLAAAVVLVLACAAPAAADEDVVDIILEGSVEPLEAEKSGGGKTTVTINSDVLFDFGKATLTPTAKTHLERLARRMTGKPVQVDGFTDSVGSPAFNLKLSRERASAVQSELQRLGVAGIRAKGFGEARPVAPNQVSGKDNPEGRAKNRRVELIF